MGCGCSSDNSGDTYSAKKSYPWKQGRANECCTPRKEEVKESECCTKPVLRHEYSPSCDVYGCDGNHGEPESESSCCKKPASGYSVYAEETENGLELREMINGTVSELNQYKKHLVDTGIGKRDAEDMMQLIIKHMHDQNEILDQIRCELKNLRKIGGF